MLQKVAHSMLASRGWSLEKKLPPTDKYVLIGAPHTSNWDFPLAMLAMAALDIRFNWVGKHSMFVFPVAGVFRKMGGIPLDRSKSSGFIDYLVSLYESSEKLAIAIAPEGTRSYTDHWKSGFYYIAKRANVPIAFGFMDYAKKHMGIGGWMMPGEDVKEDMKTIAAFYEGLKGKFPDQQGPIRFALP